MGTIAIADHRFSISRARLVVYHGAGADADWNLALYRDTAEPLWLSGTVAPGPFPDAAALLGARFTVELRSLDEVCEALLGRPVTLYPNGQARSALILACTGLGADRIHLSATFDFDWDRYLATFETEAPTLAAAIDLEVEVGELHPGRLP